MVKKKTPIESGQTAKRAYLKQSDVPSASLEEALRVPQVIIDHYAGKPTTPLQLAKTLNVDPKGSQIKVLSGAAIAFGLIEGGAQAANISVTDLAQRILRPKEENEELIAKREAVLKPRIFNDFLSRYNGNAFPRNDIAMNVLEEMGVPRDKTEEVLERIDASARSVGFIEEIKEKNYITLHGAKTPITTDTTSPETRIEPKQIETSYSETQRKTIPPPIVQPKGAALTAAIADDQRRRKVFITHGKNRDLVEPIKKLLEYGELEPVVSVERTSVSKPVPEKVMGDMRGCGAAIINVEVEQTIIDNEGIEHVFLNPNVLIEIGAAMAFYGRRFILLVREGVKLPSNLQGLFEVRYGGDTLDANATIKLLEAIKDIKNYVLPTQQEAES
jgi:predicted nucleotide-binding protein